MEEDLESAGRIADQETRGEAAHGVGKALASGAAGLIAVAGGGPVAGALAVAGQVLVDVFFKNPAEARRDIWLRDLWQAIEEIQRRQGEQDPEQVVERLTQDHEFITTLHQATVVATRTHQEEKLAALRNAVVNSALPGAPEMDVRSVYLRLVDELSPSHLRILAVFDDPLPALQAGSGLVRLSRRSSKLTDTQLLEAALPDLRGKHWQVFTRHLGTEGLRTSAGDTMEKSWAEALLPSTTPFGRGFLEFIRPSANFPEVEAARTRTAVLERLRAELTDRGRSRRFEVAPIRKVALDRGADPVVTDIAVRFPREAARRPVANGNPPSLAELRVSAVGKSIVDVFSFGRQPELVGSEEVHIRLGDQIAIEDQTWDSPARAADALIELLESVFPDHRYWG